MPYLSVSNFWKYQNADVWKKSKTHPPWFKHYVHRDREMDALPLEARLLWTELLATATRYSNVIEADLNWLYAETRVPSKVIAEMLPLLLKGGWVSQTRSPRRSRKPSRETLDDPRDQDEDEERHEDEDFDLPALDSKAGLDFDSAREGLPPSQTLEERDPQDAPGVLLDALTDADQGTETILRNFRLPEYAYRQALEEVTQRGRSAKLAVTILKRIADEQANPPDLTDPTRTNIQPADPEAAIRTMITNGSMTDPIHLDAELRAANLNGTTADQLRALLEQSPDPVTTSPDDDIPL